MRKILIALLSACLSLPALATTGYTTVVSTQMTDGSGQPLASGTATLRVVDNAGHPLSVKLTGGGQIITAPFTAAVTNGAFTIPSIDVSQSVPSFPCIQLTVTNDADGSVIWQNPCLQPTGATYSLDQFTTSTTPIYPQAGDTVPGNLSVNGNLSVTGNLAMGGLTTTTFSSVTTNGIINAAQYAGSDIGAKVNAAFAFCVTVPAACTVMVPPGSYSYSTSILVPGNTSNTGNMELDLSGGTVLNYTGSSYGIKTATAPGGQQGHYVIKGGFLNGTSAAKGGVLLAPGVNGTVVEGMIINGFSAGDCILDAGTNAAQIIHNKATGCIVGFHAFGAPGYASNNLLVQGNAFAGNTWGVIDGDITQWSTTSPFPGFNGLTTGVSSPMYGNSFIANDFEANTAGAAMEGLTVGTTYQGNYVESNPRGIILGMAETPLTSAQLTFLYGRTGENGGTTKDATVRSNFFTTGSLIHDLIEIRAAGNAVIDGNSTDSSTGPSVCFIDIYTGSTPWIGTNETANVTHPLCQGGAAGWPFNDTLPVKLAGTFIANGIFAGGSAPTLTVNTIGVGTGGTATVSAGSTATTGQLTINTGTGTFGSQVVVVTFDTGASFTALHGLALHITPANPAAAGAVPYQGATSATQVQLDMLTGLAASTTYVFNYIITGY